MPARQDPTPEGHKDIDGRKGTTIMTFPNHNPVILALFGRAIGLMGTGDRPLIQL
jgi:hypothetical protein